MISIIVPVYNAASFLSDMLDSILGQSYQDIELILVNDGSKDNSSEICHEYEKRYTCVRVFDRENHGASATRNFGLEQARGEFVWFMDSDDYLAENALFTALELQQKYDADVVIGGMNFCFTQEQRNVPRSVSEEFAFAQSEFKTRYKELFEKNYISSLCNKMIRRSVIMEQELRMNEILYMYEDYEFCMDLLMKCKRVACTPMVFYHYMLRSTQSLSHRYKPDIDRMFHILNVKIAAYMKSFHDDSEARASLSNLMIYLSYECVKNEARCKEAPKKKMRALLKSREFQNVMRSFRGYGRKYQIVHQMMKHKMVLALWIYLKASGKNA
ncbi:MAG: glycosyltransferase family 2 protein [Clostridia bacterium]|nr:glycosyltransferase family 2 protein [Clostridia bacterium]